MERIKKEKSRKRKKDKVIGNRDIDLKNEKKLKTKERVREMEWLSSQVAPG